MNACASCADARASPSCRCRSPRPARRRARARRCSGSTRRSPRPAASTASVSPASRSSSSSPTQAITLQAAPRARPRRAARTVSSVSPKYWRRSEWPTIAPWTPSSRSIGAEISPVNAPSSSQCTFCAATRCPCPPALHRGRERDVRRADDRVDAQVRRRGTRRRTRRVSAGPLNIFQLPAISIGLTPHRDRGHAGELLALEQLERGAAAGGDPRDAVGEAELVQRPHRVAAADDRERLRSRRPRRRPRSCPAAKRGHSKTPIGPFQKTVFAVGDRGGERLARLRPDVEAEPAVRQVVVRRRPRSRRPASNEAAATTSRGQLDRRTRAGSRRGRSSAILPPTSTRVGTPAEVARARRACRRPSRRRRRARTAARPRRAARRGARARPSSSRPA